MTSEKARPPKPLRWFSPFFNFANKLNKLCQYSKWPFGIFRCVVFHMKTSGKIIFNSHFLDLRGCSNFGGFCVSLFFTFLGFKAGLKDIFCAPFFQWPNGIKVVLSVFGLEVESSNPGVVFFFLFFSNRHSLFSPVITLLFLCLSVLFI